MVIPERIYHALHKKDEAPAVALDIAKAFNRLWHTCLLHKMKNYGVSEQIFELIHSVLFNDKMKLILKSTLLIPFVLMQVFVSAPSFDLLYF